ncbi:MAG TPA: Calx-beta domain-containing protein [Vicinamibacteria bacterium]|nr:Calx-beta domain-containing protein [Vicinamibacteria bacterium]
MEVRSSGASSLALSVLVAASLGVEESAWGQGDPITFSVIGDVPYSVSEKADFQSHMDNHNLFSPSEFLVHLGDIKSGSTSCVESWYSDMANSMKTLAVPGFIVPGDNEWVDCSNPNQGWAFWVTHLLRLEQNFCGTPVVEVQTVRTENFAFMKSGVLFVGINKVSGGLSSQEKTARLQDDADWVTQQFQTHGGAVRAAVVFSQADPMDSPFESQFRAASSQFGKQVLFVHGDGHSWIEDHPFPEPNILRVQVERGDLNAPPVQVTVTASGSFVLERNPWPPGAVPYNQGPCVDAGPDLLVAVDDGVLLNGMATDDGVPTGDLFVNWTQLSGPGTVFFDDASSPTPTAFFDAEGTYQLSLTADDGELVAQDTVLVNVEIDPNFKPMVTITAPANGSTFGVGTQVTFSGSASDFEDGDLSASLSWVSDLDGGLGTGAQVSTSALSLGTHLINASVTDSGGRFDSDTVSVTIDGTSVLDVPVVASSDDAEEKVTNGSVSLTSSDLELVLDSVDQVIGMRFVNVGIPKDASITSAYVQFQAEATDSVPTSLTIRGQWAGSAATFTSATGNISSRATTAAAVPWNNISPWTRPERGPNQRTPNIASVVAEIVSHPNWSSTSSMVILISGTGKRTAESFDGSVPGAPLLHVEFSTILNDPAGIAVSPTSGLTTTEAGGTAAFTVVLTAQPTANVTVGLSSSDTTEGSVSPASLIFSTANWNVPQTVTVTGVNDTIADGNQPYTIVTAPATSTDLAYNTLNPSDVSVTNTDDDTAGITVSPTSGLTTTEAGGTATFTVVLTTQPSGDVTVGLSSSDTTEGSVSPASLIFSTANWNVPQTVTVTGVNDAIADGNQSYTIVTAPATSTDLAYNGLTPSDVSVTNTDNDTAGITVSPTSGLTTTEAGGTATFTVVLTAQPSGDVTVGLSSSDATEGSVSPPSLTFTTSSWNTPQTVTVTGVNDTIADGIQSYTIVTAAATSTDLAYNGLNPSDVSVTNTDNDIQFQPSADAYVDSKSPTANFGSAPDLQLRAHQKQTLRSYLRFDVTGLGATPISSVKVQLFLTQGSAGSTVGLLLPGGTTWSETTITWETAPPIGGVSLGSPQSIVGGWIEIDVTGLVNGNGTYTIALTDSTPGRVSYASRESGTTAPVLVFEVQP